MSLTDEQKKELKAIQEAKKGKRTMTPVQREHMLDKMGSSIPRKKKQ